MSWFGGLFGGTTAEVKPPIPPPTPSHPPTIGGLADLFPEPGPLPRPSAIHRTLTARRNLHFFDIPQEVRQKLYTHLFRRHHPLDLRSLRPPPLALANRLLFAEVTDAVLRENTIGIEVPVLYDLPIPVSSDADAELDWDYEHEVWTETQIALRRTLAYDAGTFATGAMSWMSMVGGGRGIRLRRVVFWLRFPSRSPNYTNHVGRAEVHVCYDSLTGSATVRSSLQDQGDDKNDEAVRRDEPTDPPPLLLLSPRPCTPLPPTTTPTNPVEASPNPYTFSPLPPPPSSTPKLIEATTNPYTLSPLSSVFPPPLSTTSHSSTLAPPSSSSAYPRPPRESARKAQPDLSPLETAAAAQGFETLCVVVGGIVARKGFEGFTMDDLDVMAGAFEVGKVWME